MPDKPWGPQGEGEWVEITEEILEKLTFPCWGTQRKHSIPRLITKAGDRITLQWKSGESLKWSYSKLLGQYVWVPVPANQPDPEPERRPDLPDKPWGPEGKGWWVKITRDNLHTVKTPCWIGRSEDFNYEQLTSVSMSGTTLFVSENGTRKMSKLPLLVGEYVWVPAPAHPPESPTHRPAWVPEGWKSWGHCACRRFVEGEDKYMVEVSASGCLSVNNSNCIPMPSTEAAFAAAEALACGRWEKEDEQ